VRKSGYSISNVDSTVILERPKLKDHRLEIRESLAETLGIGVDRVSVKFKTAEKVGPVGEGKSAEAQAVVLLVGQVPDLPNSVHEPRP
jgi:2-C-methyl-D-erythritol 2,4-cyclodiphosphate synthase